jgi:hypothetical protein
VYKIEYENKIFAVKTFKNENNYHQELMNYKQIKEKNCLEFFIKYYLDIDEENKESNDEEE